MAQDWSPALYPRSASVGATVGATVGAVGQLSLLEWAALADDVEGELVDGRLTEEEVPDPVHALAASWLLACLRRWLEGRGGFVFDADVRLAVSATQGRKADGSVYLPGRPPPPRRGLLRAPPDIVIEVVSPTPRDERRDRIEKMSEYAAFGVSYHWLVDPALGSFEVFRLGPEQRYTKLVGATGGCVGDWPGLDGLVVDVDALWSELDRLRDDDGP